MTAPTIDLPRCCKGIPKRNAGGAYAKLQRAAWSQAGAVTVTKGRAIAVRSIVKPKPDAERYARTVLAVAMERQGLTPPWARPQVDSLPSKRSSNGCLGNTEVGANT
jgi:hypothetical protein